MSTAGLTALDVMVMLSLGVAAGFGALRGFVAEVFTLAAWIAGVVALRLFQAPASLWLEGPVGTAGGATLLATALVFGLAFLGTRLAGNAVGRTTRALMLGPVDRVLGVGFGLLKGLVIATIAFLFMSLVFDLLNGARAERPGWMTQSRTYTLLRASSAALVEAVEDVRDR